MPSLFLVLAAASAASASVDVVWQYAKASQSSLSVYNGTSLLAQSCSSFLSDETTSIDFSDVDENGFGNFTVGHKHYLVHSKAEYSGGPICIKKFNHEATVVECSGVNWEPSPKVKIDHNCHSKEHETVFRFLNSKNSKSFAKREPSPINDPPPCSVLTMTSLVGDGDPHQNYFHKQLSEVVSCGSAPSCSVGNTQSVSYTIGWTASLTPVSWISGGFSVSESWSTGNTYSCTGSTGEDVCVWYNTAHTAYTVQNMQRDSCAVGGGWDADGDPFVMFSPNANNRGGGYYCVIGTCRAQGDNYWDYSGRAGGP
ncbi:uncharacterized protein FIESC28_01161 [Fusarium coffeatum]|uniref:Ig-like domain-containing protein n=1 Tax=Fusarium coffeatum TaxID=231269 RepID=A0A366S9X6_9HYPO|nr:uncharacterized protein FIESC28_01161 [Fusarium coffeatum]RBR26133.1 hypothetical protein FIESC28_01161 [Fusarium coffeatum]